MYLGPGQIFVYFAKKSATSFLRQVRPVIFRSNKAGQIFCQAWNLTDLLIYTPWFEGKVSIKKIWSLFLEVFQSEAHQNYLIFARQSNSEDGRFIPRYAALWSLLRLQLLWFPSLHSSWIFRAKYCSIYASLCKPTKYTFVFQPPKSAECMYKLHHDWKQPSWGFKSRQE